MPDPSKLALRVATSTFERLFEERYLIVVVVFVLFIDIVCTSFLGRNLLSIKFDWGQPFPFGYLASIVLLFGLFMAVVLPILGVVGRHFVLIIVDTLMLGGAALEAILRAILNLGLSVIRKPHLKRYKSDRWQSRYEVERYTEEIHEILGEGISMSAETTDLKHVLFPKDYIFFEEAKALALVNDNKMLYEEATQVPKRIVGKIAEKNYQLSLAITLGLELWLPLKRTVPSLAAELLLTLSSNTRFIAYCSLALLCLYLAYRALTPVRSSLFFVYLPQEDIKKKNRTISKGVSTSRVILVDRRMNRTVSARKTNR